MPEVVRGGSSPRSRGTRKVAHVGLLVCGSSPRSRGTRHRRQARQRPVRFIPAIAGNTSETGEPRRIISVHPRDRGEHPGDFPAGKFYDGSSPRSRGTRYRKIRPAYTHRFIPAIAGNTLIREANGTTTPVHPRDRGEHFPEFPIRTLLSGSSPRSQGTLEVQVAHPAPLRFIPAIAGNTPKHAQALV